MKRPDAERPWSQPPSREPPPGTTLQTTTPARPPDLRGDVAVPILQALFSGAIVAALIVYALSELRPEWNINAFKLWVGLALAIAGAVWGWLLIDTRALLRTLERLVGADLDRDGTTGPPVVRVEVTGPGKRKLFLELPGPPAALRTLARGVLNGRSFSEGSWSGRGALFSRSEFRTIRDTMIERGLAVWRNPKAKNQGVELTAAGRTMFRRLAELDGE